MAVDLQSRESLLIPSLPPFCTGEDSLLSTDNGAINHQQQRRWSSSSFSSYSGSALSSPGGSELGSTESSDTDEEEDNYMAELTRQMAHSMLQDDDIPHEQKWSNNLGGSPQSPLWSRLGSNREEVPPFNKSENLKANEEEVHNKYCNNSNESLLNPSVTSTEARSPTSEFQSKQALIDEKIRAIQLLKLKQQQIMKQQLEENLYWRQQDDGLYQKDPKQEVWQSPKKGKASGGGGRHSSSGNKKVSWTTLQQQQQRSGSEMRAVFLGQPSSKKGCSGTGVFLPRGIGNTSESRKKSGCSTVLIPARVVQALKLHFDKLGVESRPIGANFPFQHDALMGDVKYGLQLQQKSQSQAVPAMAHHPQDDDGLPQEWTY